MRYDHQAASVIPRRTNRTSSASGTKPQHNVYRQGFHQQNTTCSGSCVVLNRTVCSLSAHEPVGKQRGQSCEAFAFAAA